MFLLKELVKKISLLFVLRINGRSNSINILGKLKKSKIRVNGNNNTVIIEDGNYKNIDIGINGNNHKVIIKASNRIHHLQIIVQNKDNEILIEEGVGISGAKLITCGTKNSIKIGKDCMISDNVEMWGCDGHSIIQDGNVLNFSRPIIVGSFVWIGAGVRILKGTKIGNNSVVGMGSVLTGKGYPENVVIAGFPAKVLKENVSWTVENLEDRS